MCRYSTHAAQKRFNFSHIKFYIDRYLPCSLERLAALKQNIRKQGALAVRLHRSGICCEATTYMVQKRTGDMIWRLTFRGLIAVALRFPIAVSFWPYCYACSAGCEQAGNGAVAALGSHAISCLRTGPQRSRCMTATYRNVSTAATALKLRCRQQGSSGNVPAWLETSTCNVCLAALFRCRAALPFSQKNRRPSPFSTFSVTRWHWCSTRIAWHSVWRLCWDLRQGRSRGSPVHKPTMLDESPDFPLLIKEVKKNERQSAFLWTRHRGQKFSKKISVWNVDFLPLTRNLAWYLPLSTAQQPP